MNLRIDAGSLRFRITADDLQSLLQGNNISDGIGIGDKLFNYSISSSAEGKKMFVEMMPYGLHLTVPEKSLQDLLSMGRSKEGLSIIEGNTTISLQVDLKIPHSR